MNTIDTCLIFNGNCGEATRFCEKTFGAKLEKVMTQAELPPGENCPPGDSEGGQIKIPMGKTFRAGIFAMVVDRFGAPRMVSGGTATV